MQAKDYLPFAAFLLSVASLLVVLYEKFWQGPKLSASIDQLILLRLPAVEKQNLFHRLLINDLLSETPSPSAAALVPAIPGLKQAIATQDPATVHQALMSHGQKGHHIKYDPTPEHISTVFADPMFARSFGLPVTVANSGRKVAHLSSFVLVFRRDTQPNDRWLYVPVVSLDSKKLSTPAEGTKDTDRVAGLFVGMTVHPGSSARDLLWFAPQQDVEGETIQTAYMPVGKYHAALLGFGPGGKKTLQTAWVPFELKQSELAGTLTGSEVANQITGSEPARAALNAK